MPADISRDTFRPRRHYSGVIMQQGRVQVDADWNEQRDIAAHYLRRLAADVIGPHGGTAGAFALTELTDAKNTPVPFDVAIGAGHYYVDGILCENVRPTVPCSYLHQPDYPVPQIRELKDNHKYVFYLDVWERTVVSLQDDEIREVALGGPDTAARVAVVWQVKVLDITNDTKFQTTFTDVEASQYVHDKLPTLGTGRLRVRAAQPDESDQPCTVSPASRFTGLENQLYRVEIHHPGTAGQATFKWSRDNGSVVFGVSHVTDETVVLEDLGRDARLTLTNDNWVEFVDDRAIQLHRTEPLLQVMDIDTADSLVRLSGPPPGLDHTGHPLLRRWDHRLPTGAQHGDGALPVREGEWLDLEAGVEIYFDHNGSYETGDYWEIPARTATGDVDWPGPVDQPAALQPRGIRHHYAPLGLVTVGAGGSITVDKEYRREIAPVAKPV